MLTLKFKVTFRYLTEKMMLNSMISIAVLHRTEKEVDKRRNSRVSMLGKDDIADEHISRVPASPIVAFEKTGCSLLALQPDRIPGSLRRSKRFADLRIYDQFRSVLTRKAT
jgi:hypothetical protein